MRTLIFARSLSLVAVMAGCTSVNPSRIVDGSTEDRSSNADRVVIPEDVQGGADAIATMDATRDMDALEGPEAGREAGTGAEAGPAGDACVPTGAERCNGVDDDCDGMVDEGFDFQTDIRNCGGCNAECGSRPNAVVSCAMGRCASTCNPGFGDCDGNSANGCETALNSETNCGRCGNACSGATPMCSDPLRAMCGSGCGTGLTRCGTTCVNLQTDAMSCGACGTACPTGANASATCAAGRCGVTCASGYGNCDGNASNGCEVDLRSSATSCGACGTACPARANAASSCSAGVCGFACNPGFADCDGNAANGCEVDTRSNVSNCGVCGTRCMFANATATCSSGACTLGACNVGFGNCDTMAANGCETPVNTTSNCGACGRTCSFANAGASCTAGACAIGTCATGFGNCDGNAANGCETALNTPANCGACGSACGSSAPMCSAATRMCVTGCGPGEVLCSGTCANTQTNINNCGACGTRCAYPNGIPDCAAGACRSGGCDRFFGDCDGVIANGCEVDTRSSASHCGGCGAACALANATAACTNSACTVATCNAGFANCDGAAANGCETETRSNPSNCGACGLRCSSGVCSNGACVCPAGQTACNGVCVNTNTDTGNCGACGYRCGVGSNVSCISGRCYQGFTCDPRTADCNGNPLDGYEIDVDNDPRNCGSCGTRCLGSCCNGRCGSCIPCA